MSARCEEVILTEQQRGAGVEGDPLRLVVMIYAKDGTLLAERDPETPAYCAGWTGQTPGGWALAQGTRLRLVHEGISTDRLANYSRDQIEEALTGKGAPWPLVNAHREAVTALIRGIDADDPIEAEELKRLVATIKTTDAALGRAT